MNVRILGLYLDPLKIVRTLLKLNFNDQDNINQDIIMVFYKKT